MLIKKENQKPGIKNSHRFDITGRGAGDSLC